MRTFIVFFAALLWWRGTTFSADQPIKLSLAEAVKMASEKNLDVRVELYNPAIFEAELNKNKAIYDPILNILTNYSDTTNPINGTPAIISSRGHSFQLNTSINQLFWTGATVAFGFNNNYSNANSYQTQRDYWQSNLGVSFSQPLLKYFGRENTEIEISISRLSKFASLEHFKRVLLDTISRTRTEYFKLYSLRAQLEVRRGSLALAHRILVDTRSRVAAGVLPAMEILNAEFGVTAREKELIDAEKSVSDQTDNLRLLLQIKDSGDIIPLDLPERERYQPDQDRAIRYALSRPDIKELKRSLDISELQTRVFSNNLRPDLSLNISGSLVGQDYSYGRDLDRLWRIDYPAWGVGLVLSYPLGNRAADNDYRKSRLKNAQTALQIRNQEQIATNEVLNSIRAINSAYRQIEVADRGRVFAEERLHAYMRKNQTGLATTKDVLEVENDLTVAKNSQIAAAVAYDNAITRHFQVTGELLEKEGIRVIESDADRLYANTR